MVVRLIVPDSFFFFLEHLFESHHHHRRRYHHLQNDAATASPKKYQNFLLEAFLSNPLPSTRNLHTKAALDAAQREEHDLYQIAKRRLGFR